MYFLAFKNLSLRCFYYSRLSFLKPGSLIIAICPMPNTKTGFSIYIFSKELTIYLYHLISLFFHFKRPEKTDIENFN